MILIADGGSTKTDWCVADGPHVAARIATGGTNPFFQTEREIADEVAAGLLPRLAGLSIGRISFYGAGCAFPEKIAVIERVLSGLLPGATVGVGSDMLAAARALCGHEEGIACILGTGSNSCYYDGEQIMENVSPLGFILGDEGSGAVLGRLFVGDCLKNQLPAGLREEFLARYGPTPADILEAVYRKPFPNRFLAGFSPFIAEHLDVPRVRETVLGSFHDFFRRNVMQYEAAARLPVHFTGSVAWHYADLLRDAAAGLGLSVGRIVRSPMDGLVEYHSKTQ